MEPIIMVICAVAVVLLLYSIVTVLREKLYNGESLLQIASLIAVIVITIIV